MKLLHVAARELSALLGSAIGWVVITAFSLVSGLVFFLAVMGYAQSSEDLIAQPYAGVSFTFADYLLWPYFSFQALFLLFLLPGITMRLFSEELRQHTLELLETSPISTWEIVLGKFAGAMAFVTVMLALNGWAPFFLWWVSEVELVLLLCGTAGVWLASACIVALGMAASASTSHQVLALVIAEAFAFGLLLIAGLEAYDSTGLLSQLAITPHLEDLTRGLLRASDMAYFAAFIGFFLLATQQRLAIRRWT